MPIRLEELQPNAIVRGVLPDTAVTVVSVRWSGTDALELVYKDPSGRRRQTCSCIATTSRGWSSCRAGPPLEPRWGRRSVSPRLRSAPHQARAPVRSRCWRSTRRSSSRSLTRSPRSTRRCSRASPSGSCSPTIPARARRSWRGSSSRSCRSAGDLHRCLVVCPGSLVEQWQDELYRRFQLPFEIMTNDKLEAARTGQLVLENEPRHRAARQVARDERVQAKLAAPECRWDLVVVRRGAQDVGDASSAARSSTPSATSSASSCRASRGTSCC
ncbi:MAG: hypothetical protein KatS3mg121_1314 [Gammaproteobacteria bacterium]|nr:MAG: hypothetical protein KatS3mg121_1314 [Gammaproteobacteria bacterium]